MVVELSGKEHEWMLIVEDDGRGFDFEGRRSGAELDAWRAGPVIILERARAMGGQATVVSTPGRGARIEVRFGSTSNA